MCTEALCYCRCAPASYTARTTTWQHPDHHTIQRVYTASVQVEQFVASTDVRESSTELKEDEVGDIPAERAGVADAVGDPMGTVEDLTGEAKPETDQEPDRTQELAAIVAHELRKGVDVGDVTAARAQAIRR